MVSRLVRAEVNDRFTAEDAARIVAALDAADLGPGAERVHLGILKLARGDWGRFWESLRLAEEDWRDLLVAAGLANENWPWVLARAGFRVPPRT